MFGKVNINVVEFLVMDTNERLINLCEIWDSMDNSKGIQFDKQTEVTIVAMLINIMETNKSSKYIKEYIKQYSNTFSRNYNSSRIAIIIAEMNKVHDDIFKFITPIMLRSKTLSWFEPLTNAQRQTKRQRISEMTEFLAIQSGIITEYDDKLTRQLIEKITVFEGTLQVSFKSGVEFTIEQ